MQFGSVDFQARMPPINVPTYVIGFFISFVTIRTTKLWILTTKVSKMRHHIGFQGKATVASWTEVLLL